MSLQSLLDRWSGQRTKTEDLQTSHGGVFDADRAPTQSVGAQPLVDSDEALQRALCWLSWLSSRTETVEARCDQLVRLVRQQATEDLQIDIDGTLIAADRYRQLVSDAIVAYATQERDRLFEDGKTLNFAAGQLTLRKTAARLTCDPDEQGVIEQFLGQLSEVERTVLESAQTILAPFLRIQLKVDKQRLLGEWKTRMITADRLAEHGIEVATGESIAVEPHQYEQIHQAA